MLVRVKFYKIETTKTGTVQHYLGFQDVLNKQLPDGCSVIARAFRNCTSKQKEANSFEIEQWN